MSSGLISNSASTKKDEHKGKRKSSMREFARKLKLIGKSDKRNNRGKQNQRTKNRLEDYIKEQNWPLVLKELDDEERFRRDFIFEAMFLERCNSDETQNSADEEQNKGRGGDDDIATNILLMACQQRAPECVVNAIMALYPNMVFSVEGKSGKTALHYACESGASLGVIESLCDEMLVVSPSTIARPNLEGKTALRCALENQAPLEVTSYLSDMSVVVQQAARLNRKLAKQDEKFVPFFDDCGNRHISIVQGAPALTCIAAKKA